MITVYTVEKSWKNVVLAKKTANDWLKNDRSGKHATNLKCLYTLLSLCKTYR